MRIDKLEAINFRNYEKISAEFDKGINLFYGDNAQGKTNLLEAVYICSSTRSHRGKDSELIRFGCDEAHIRAFITKNDISHKIDIHYRKNQKKGAAVDGKSIKKASELLGFLNVVLFSPEDLSIIKSGPSERRRFIDRELCQIDAVYMKNLAAYNKVLENRNRLLKDISTNKGIAETLDIWDEQLVTYGCRIIEAREKFLNEIDVIMEPVFQKITGGEISKTEYLKSASKESFYDSLKRNRERDIYTFQTNIGPHRDDFSLYSNGHELKVYGSQGQVKSAAICLKLAEIKMIKEYKGEYPVLLLDDVMSELDSRRQEYLLEEINETQTIITATGMEDLLNKDININRKYYVSSGKLSEI